MSTIAETARVLRNIEAGQRAWFWFSPDVPRAGASLMMASLDDADGLENLIGWRDARALPDGTLQSLGAVMVGNDGVVRLVSRVTRERMLAALALWVRRHVETFPSLALLSGARLVTLGEDGEVYDELERASFWTGVPYLPMPGTMAHTARELAALEPGAGAWFWMTDRGPGRAPFLLISPTEDDPKARAFRGQVVRLRARSEEAGRQIIGTLRRTRGRLVLTADMDVAEGWQGCLQALQQAHPEIPLLQDAVFMATQDGALVPPPDPPAALDLSRHGALLEGFGADSRLLYWFASDRGDGQPVLLVEDDKAALKKAASGYPEASKTVRGQLAHNPKGWPEFRAHSAAPGFVAALAGFVSAHAAQQPALLRLSGSRFVAKDAEGTIIDRQKDSAAWAALASENNA